MSTPPKRKPGGIGLSHVSARTERAANKLLHSPQPAPPLPSRHTLSDKPVSTFTFIRIQRMVRRWRRRAKNSHHRLQVLNEWIKTEKNYIRDLEVILARIEKPMRQAEMLSPDKLQFVFPNVEVLAMLSKSMLADLEKIRADWKPSTPYFRVYIEYCKKYYKGMELLKPLRNTEAFQQLEKSLPMDIDSYLIKPIQRPPKYMLLMRDYHKHMNDDHPDYRKMEEAIEKYHLINEINDESIAREGRHQIFFRLEKLYGHLIESNRELRREMRASAIDCELKLYVFNDLILINRVLDEHHEDSYKVLELDRFSFVEVVPDGKYFSHKLLLCGRYEAVHLFFSSTGALKREYEFFRELLQQSLQDHKQRRTVDHRQRSEQKVTVTLNDTNLQQKPFLPHFKITVRGAEKRPIALLRNETVYKVRFQTMKPWCLHQNVQLHYSSVEALYSSLHKRFPDLLFPDLSPAVLEVGLYDQTKNRSKIIQYRTMAIQEFLNRIFRSDRVMGNPVTILEVLAISNELWMFAVEYSEQESIPQCECKGCLQLAGTPITLELYLEERQRHVASMAKRESSDYCMLRYIKFEAGLLALPRRQIVALEPILLYLEAFEGQLDFCRLRPSRPQRPLAVRVYLLNLSDEDFVELQLNEQTTAGEGLGMLGRKLGIVNLQDFGLFLTYEGEPRLLDAHETLYQAMVQVEAEVKSESSGSFVSTLKQGLKYLGGLVTGRKSKLYLRKYFFLMPEVECSACQSNSARFRLTLEQGLFDISRDLIRTSDAQLAQITAIYLHLKGVNKFPHEIVRRLLPQQRLTLLQNREWTRAVSQIVEQLLASKTSKPEHIYERLLRLLQQNLGWEHHYFFLQCHNPEKLPGRHSDVLLGISYKNIVVVARKSREILLQVPLELLTYKISVFSFFLQLEEQTYRFDGRMLFDADKLIRKYLLMRRLLPHLYDGVSQSQIRDSLPPKTIQDT